MNFWLDTSLALALTSRLRAVLGVMVHILNRTLGKQRQEDI